MELLSLLLILSFGFMLRLSFSSAESSDDWVSFWLIQRQGGGRWLTYEVSDSMVRGIYGYPVLQHFIVSRFPEKYWEHTGRILNILYDLATALCVYGVTRWLSMQMGVTILISGLDMAAVATLLFLTTPILLPVTARMRAIKARSMGLMLTTLYFCAMGIWSVTGGWHYLLAAVLIGQLIILSSMFALQVLVLFSCFLSLFFLSPVPTFIIIVTLIVGYYLPKVGTRESLRFMWHHKRWYVRNYEKGTTAAKRNSLREILLLPYYMVVDFRKFLLLSFVKVTPIIAIYSAPIPFALVVIWLVHKEQWTSMAQVPYLAYAWGIVAASLVAFLLTSFKQLSFIGQAERYLEYSAPAFSLIFPFVLITYPEGTRTVMLWSLILIHIIFTFANFLFVKREAAEIRGGYVPGDLQEVVDWCTRKLNSARIATVPCKLGFLLSTIMGMKVPGRYEFYYKFILRSNETGFRYYEEDTGGYEKVRDGWIESKEIFKATPHTLSKQYGATHLLINKKYEAGLSKVWGGELDLFHRPVFENATYVVCTIQQE
jgi:hypothetical protein